MCPSAPCSHAALSLSFSCASGPLSISLAISFHQLIMLRGAGSVFPSETAYISHCTIDELKTGSQHSSADLLYCGKFPSDSCYPVLVLMGSSASYHLPNHLYSHHCGSSDSAGWIFNNYGPMGPGSSVSFGLWSQELGQWAELLRSIQ